MDSLMDKLPGRRESRKFLAEVGFFLNGTGVLPATMDDNSFKNRRNSSFDLSSLSVGTSSGVMNSPIHHSLSENDIQSLSVAHNEPIDLKADHCGWLKKLGRERKNWKYRFFVLHSGFLWYFTDETMEIVKGVFNIADGLCTTSTKHQHDGTNSHLEGSKELQFSLISPHRTLYLRSNSEKDRERWIDRISASVMFARRQYMEMDAAAPSRLLQDVCVQRSGWLKKQGRIRRSWKKRWFEIVGRKMFYYEQKDRPSSLKGVVKFSAETLIIEMNPVINIGPSSRFCFCVITENRSLFLSVDDQEEGLEWMVWLREYVLQLRKELELDEWRLEETPACAKLKKEGATERLNGQAWNAAVGGVAFNAENPGYYVNLSKVVQVDENTDTSTYFGSDLSELREWTGDGGGTKIAAAKRLLTRLSLQNSDFEHCPMIAYIAIILMVYGNEASAFVTCHCLLEKARRRNAFLPKYRVESLRLVEDFTLNLKFLLPELHEHFKLIALNIPELASSWLFSLFLNVVPWGVVVRIMDLFLIDGQIVLLRIGLSLMKLHSSALQECATKEEVESFFQEMKWECTDPKPIEDMAQEVFETTVSSENVDYSRMRGSTVTNLLSLVQNPEWMKAPSYYPLLEGNSSILSTESILMNIWGWLPRRYAVMDAHVIFNSAEDGLSLQRLYQKCDVDSATILLVKTLNGEVFGAFNTDGWRKSSHYYGNGLSFVFSIYPKLKHYVWNRGQMQMFVLGTPLDLIVGSGGSGHAIRLRSDMATGSSDSCATFGNEAFVQKTDGSPDFNTAAVEVIKIAPAETKSTPKTLKRIGSVLSGNKLPRK